MDRRDKAKRLNLEVDMLGLRAQATAVGLLQLCAELLEAGVLGNEAITRIKNAIADQIMVSYRPRQQRAGFEASLHKRLDALFPVAGKGGHPPAAVGDATTMRTELAIGEGED